MLDCSKVSDWSIFLDTINHKISIIADNIKICTKTNVEPCWWKYLSLNFSSCISITANIWNNLFLFFVKMRIAKEVPHIEHSKIHTFIRLSFLNNYILFISFPTVNRTANIFRISSQLQSWFHLFFEESFLFLSCFVCNNLFFVI